MSGRISNSRVSRLLLGLLPLALAALVLVPDGLVAQAAELGRQRLGRPYLFVFLAYAIGWALIFGWIVSIARRLGSLERKIEDE